MQILKTRRIQRNCILLILLVILILGFIPLMMFQQLKGQIRSLEAEVQMLQDDQAMMNYNQKRLIEAVTSWIEHWQVDTFESSAYSPLDDWNGLNSWGDGSVMASGAKTREVIDTAIAVDPDVIPLGSRVYIKGIGWRTALDTGGAIKGKKIDICKRTFDEAVRYGTQKVLVVYPKEGRDDFRM